ncbi:hypothetical protein C8J57DRAFT_1673716 [Mycena rebaudengoi]|nr:hypothetical protein C8J57DRAFT_1673716 [Mycena rebaudengoi]
MPLLDVPRKSGHISISFKFIFPQVAFLDLPRFASPGFSLGFRQCTSSRAYTPLPGSRSMSSLSVLSGEAGSARADDARRLLLLRAQGATHPGEWSGLLATSSAHRLHASWASRALRALSVSPFLVSCRLGAVFLLSGRVGDAGSRRSIPRSPGAVNGDNTVSVRCRPMWGEGAAAKRSRGQRHACVIASFPPPLFVSAFLAHLPSSLAWCPPIAQRAPPLSCHPATHPPRAQRAPLGLRHRPAAHPPHAYPGAAFGNTSSLLHPLSTFAPYPIATPSLAGFSRLRCTSGTATTRGQRGLGRALRPVEHLPAS